MLSEMLKGRDRRKVGNNTYVEKRDGAVALRLHNTDIITEADGVLTVNTGGWKTHTTKDRLNAYLPGGGVYQKRGLWYWRDGSVFTDGDRVTLAGEVIAQAKPGQEKGQLKLRKRILAFARKCAEAIPLEKPGAGDCFYCGMQTKDGQSLGDATKDTGHLMSHLDEGYCVPSLVYHALKEAGNTDMVTAAAFNADAGFLADVAKRQTRKAVARYMYRRLNLPG